MRSATQPYCNTFEYGCVSLRMRFFPQNFGTIKRILPGSSSPSHREGPGVEVGDGLSQSLSFLDRRIAGSGNEIDSISKTGLDWIRKTRTGLD